MKTTLTTILVLAATTAMCQSKPRKRVTYDTIKQVIQRVDYAPDTIPVFFKEIIVDTNATSSSQGIVYRNPAYEHLTPGFVVWQTYYETGTGTVSISGTNSLYLSNTMPGFYTEDYKDNAIRDKFLYLDKRPVTNKVIYAVKR